MTQENDLFRLHAVLRERVLIFDHFDSFTHNLAQAFMGLAADVAIVRTDTPFELLRDCDPTHIVLSPGPGHPDKVTLFGRAIRHWQGTIPILGVCLGHQAIARSVLGAVERNYRLMHGKTSLIHHTGDGIFTGLPNPFTAMRYHSLVVRPPHRDKGAWSTGDGDEYEVIAWTEEGEVMGIRLVAHPNVIGGQFHPESYKTEVGEQLLANFLALR